MKENKSYKSIDRIYLECLAYLAIKEKKDDYGDKSSLMGMLPSLIISHLMSVGWKKMALQEGCVIEDTEALKSMNFMETCLNDLPVPYNRAIPLMAYTFGQFLFTLCTLSHDVKRYEVADDIKDLLYANLKEMVYGDKFRLLERQKGVDGGNKD